VLQCNWSGANSLINRNREQLSEATASGGHSLSSPADFVLGKGNRDNISGDGMVRAVMNMAIFVVNLLEKDSPKDVPDEKAKTFHQKIVVAMFVEALHALQHNQPSGFTAALFRPSMVKVVVYSEIKQHINESDAAFHLRTVEGNLKESTGMRYRDDKLHKTANCAVEIQSKKCERLQSYLADNQTKHNQEIKEEKTKRVQTERKLMETKRKLVEEKIEHEGERIKRVKAERELKEEKNTNAQLEFDVSQLQRSLRLAIQESEHRAKKQKHGIQEAEGDELAV